MKKGKEMKKDNLFKRLSRKENLLFSLDGIAKPWLLNKHGYPFFPFALNGHIKTLNLNEIGLIASAEPDVSGQCSLAVIPRDNDVYKTFLEDPVQQTGGEAMREIQKFKRDLFCIKIYLIQRKVLLNQSGLYFLKNLFLFFSLINNSELF